MAGFFCGLLLGKILSSNNDGNREFIIPADTVPSYRIDYDIAAYKHMEQLKNDKEAI